MRDRKIFKFPHCEDDEETLRTISIKNAFAIHNWMDHKKGKVIDWDKTQGTKAQDGQEDQDKVNHDLVWPRQSWR